MKIIKILASEDEGEVSSYDVAKVLFGSLKHYDLKLRDNFVRARLKRLERLGILYSKWSGNRWKYFLSKKNCRVVRGKMMVGWRTVSADGTFVVIRCGGMRLILIT